MLCIVVTEKQAPLLVLRKTFYSTEKNKGIASNDSIVHLYIFL